MAKKYAVIDLETTGPSFDQGDRIIQIGAILIEDKEVIKELNLDVNPGVGVTVPPQITRLTGITNAQLHDAVAFSDVAAELWQLLEGAVFVAHNVNFDFKFLNKTFQAEGFPEMLHKTFDTVELIRVLFPTATSYKLSDFALAHDIVLENAHTAYDDAKATVEILLLCQDKISKLPATLINQLEPYCHFFIGDTGEIISEWFKEGNHKQFNGHYTYQAPFTLVKHVKGNNVFPEAFGKHQAQSDSFLGLEMLTANNGITLRSGQQAMIKDVLSFRQQDEVKHAFLTAQAGSGKTLSYLMGSLANSDESVSRAKAIIATPTLVLQHQFLTQSLKLYANLIGRPVSFAQLKSANHYIDLTQFSFFLDYYKQFLHKMKKRDAMILMALLVWLSETHTGDKAELNRGLLNENFWQTMSALKKLSLADSIERWGDFAFYANQWQLSQSAEVVIVNYAFLFTHLEDLLENDVIREDMMMVFDESHQLPEKILQTTTRQFSSQEIDQELNQFVDLIEQLNELLLESKHDNHVYERLFDIEMQLQNLWTIFDGLSDDIADSFQNESYYKQSAKETVFYIDNQAFKQSAWRMKLLQFEQQLSQILVIINQLSQLIQSGIGNAAFRQSWFKVKYRLSYIQENIANIAIFDDKRYVTIETHLTAKSLQYLIKNQHYDPEIILRTFWQQLPTKNLLVSASNDVYSVTNQLGDRYGIDTYDSFNHLHQTSDDLLTSLVLSDQLSTDKLNEREAAKYTAEVIVNLWQQPIHKIQVVFQSTTLLNLTHTYLKRMLPAGEFNKVLAQTEIANVAKMYQTFDHSHSSVLLGLVSFNEGVHFGSSSDMLILTRLPFESPKSVRELAKQDWCQKQGMSYFDNKALPDMLMKLKQIFGRLMNDQGHRRYIVSLDKRLLTSSYQDKIKASLPQSIHFDQKTLKDLQAEIKYNQSEH